MDGSPVPDFSSGFPGQHCTHTRDCCALCHLRGAGHVTYTSVFAYQIMFRGHNGEKNAPLSTWWPFEIACLPASSSFRAAFIFLSCLEKQTDLLNSKVSS